MTVNGHERHLAQHVKYGFRLRLRVALHVIAQAVYLVAHERCLRRHRHSGKHIACHMQHHLAKVGHRLRLAHLKLALFLHLAHGRHHKHIFASLGQFLLKRAVVLGHAGQQHFGGVDGGIYAHRGVWFSLACAVVHLAHHAKLGIGCQAHHHGSQRHSPSFHLFFHFLSNF